MNKGTKDFDKLVSKALDSTLTVDESDRLESLLSGNPELQRRYCKTILLESLFHWEDSNADIKDEKVTAFPIWSIASSIAAIFVCMLSAWVIHNFTIFPSEISEEADSALNPNLFEQKKDTFNTFASSRYPKSSFKLPSLSVLEKSKDIINTIKSGSEVFNGSSIMIDNGFTVLSFEEKLSTSTSSGVMPLNDGQMLQMSEMDVDPVAQKSSSVEILRIYELNEMGLSNSTDVETAVHINQSFSDTSDQTEFVLSLHALGSENNQPISEIASSAEVLISDNDQSTWEKIDASFSLPYGTEYLVVSLAAKKSGLGALHADKHEFFADELELSFVGI